MQSVLNGAAAFGAQLSPALQPTWVNVAPPHASTAVVNAGFGSTFFGFGAHDPGLVGAGLDTTPNVGPGPGMLWQPPGATVAFVMLQKATQLLV
jgi:hypothetical protein